jgi:hypothetical protein
MTIEPEWFEMLNISKRTHNRSHPNGPNQGEHAIN